MRRDDTSQTSIAAERSRGQRRRAVLMSASLCAVLMLGACSEQITKHGHQFHDTDLQAIQPGMS